MSLGSRTILPELLSEPHVRAARRGRVAVILDASLDRLIFADATGRRIFGLSDDDALPSLLARQLRSGQRRVAEGGTARLLLRPPVGRVALPVAASMSGIGNGAKAVLLIAEGLEAGSPAEDPAGFLGAMGLTDSAAALFDPSGGLVAAGSAFPSVLANDAFLRAALTASVAEDESRHDFETPGFGLRLYRVADDLLLVQAEPRFVAAAPEAEANRPNASMNIAAIVGRWHDRKVDIETPPTLPEKRRPFRSIWGENPEPVSAEPVASSTPGLAEDAPAVTNDEPDPADEQPIDRPSVVTLPDIPSEEAPEIDQAAEENEECPGNEDLVPTPEELPPEIVRGETAAEVEAEPAEVVELTAFQPNFERAPIRFVWQIDRDGCFRSLSPEFAAAVGPKAADVIGLRFAAVSEAFGFDESGEVRRLLERRDTWSGRTVLWPVENSDRRVPIDLAALPTYSRDRSFDGFRGFGILRIAESVADPMARGMALMLPARTPEPEPESEDTLPPPAPAESRHPAGPTFRSFESELPGVSFGRRPAPPTVDSPEKIIRLGERRRPRDGALSETEEAAFRAIGVKLGKRTDTENASLSASAEEAAAPVVASSSEVVAAASESPSVAAEDDIQRPAAMAQAPEQPVEEDEFELLAAPDDASAAMLAGLPLPLLVQARDEIVYANDALFVLLGHRDLASLKAAGGLDTLFAEREGPMPADEMAVRRADGETLAARVKMQRIVFSGRSSLMMTFEVAPVTAPAPPPVDPSNLQDLRREVGELKAVLDIATDGVVLVSPDMSVRAVNGSAEALFGLGGDELRGRSLVSLFAPESQRTVLDYIEMLKDKGLAGVLNDGREVVGREAQGGFIPLFITAGRLSEERGWCVVIRDIAHWKRNEEELVNARRAAEAASLHKSRFLANITHELRTPLNAIIGFADVIASECFGPIGNERYIEYLGDIKRSGHHVLDLVNDLLDIAKIEAGKMELTFESVSLNEVLAEVVSVMQPQANRERVIVRSNLPPSVPPVVADRRTIRQIALNLLSNSVRFTPAGGQIIASTTYTAEGNVLLRVRDSGIGMTEREIELAMTPFQQVHQPGEDRGHGTGLGLPLTKAMAEANRASFEIHSKPGEGTLVEIAFPAQRVLTR